MLLPENSGFFLQGSAMGFQSKKKRCVLTGKRLVFCAVGVVFIAASCGRNSAGIPKSAVAPRKSVTVRVSGDTLLTPAQQDTLLAFARRSIAHFLKTGSGLAMPAVSDSTLLKRMGCLIKVTVDTMTRGTSGYILPVKSLAAAVTELAMRAATGGRRFEPLKPKELGRAVIQISVVSEPVTISRDSEVKVQRHGLLLMSEGIIGAILLVDDVVQSGSASAAIDRLLALSKMTRKDWDPSKTAIKTFSVQVFQENP
jgi:AMMECR1 domain-containing protein